MEISLIISLVSLSFGGGCLLTLYRGLKSLNESNHIIRLGQQAILRDRLLQGYRYFKERGWMTYQEKENMLNMYDMYHQLGANGVMDGIIEEIKNIPIKEN